jgi:hypothetical protein
MPRRKTSPVELGGDLGAVVKAAAPDVARELGRQAARERYAQQLQERATRGAATGIDIVVERPTGLSPEELAAREDGAARVLAEFIVDVYLDPQRREALLADVRAEKKP